MIFDTDVLFWCLKGHKKALKTLATASERNIPLQVYLELLQGCFNKQEQETIKKFIFRFGIKTLSLSEDIGLKAISYIEQYSLSHGLKAGDALIAASAVESQKTLVTANIKHFRFIQELQLQPFRLDF